MKKLICVSIFLGLLMIIISANSSDSKYIRVNIKESKMYVYKGGELIKEFQIALHPKKTKPGKYRIKDITKNPWWKPPPSYQALGYGNVHIPPGQNNPVKWFWIGLEVWQDGWTKAEIGIHGSLKVEGHTSMGCIRMKKDDITWLTQDYQIQKRSFVYIE